MKIFALGMVNGPHTYLQSPWNILDAIVVGTSWLPYIMTMLGFPDSSSGGGAIRAFRLLRPLRTINRFPGLKRLVTTILMSIPQMQVLAIMVLIYMFTFAVVAVQLWQGVMLQRCHFSVDDRATEACVAGEEMLCEDLKSEMLLGDTASFCDPASTGQDYPWQGKACPTAGDVCELHDTNPYNGILSFDSFGSACIPVMQMMTVSSWQEVMHIMQDVTGDFATIYFLFGTVFGGYFLFNLFVAVLKSKFEIAMAVAAEGAAVFDAVDDDGSGELDEGELKTILNNKGVFLSDEKLSEVFKQVDADGGGTIDVEEFSNWLRGDDVLAAQLRERMDVGTSRDVGQKEEISEDLPLVDQIKLKLRALQPDNDWDNLFDYYDMDGDGTIDVNEFTIILRRDLGMRRVHIGDDEIAAVFQGMDADGGGDVDAEEFAAWVVTESFAVQWLKIQAAIRNRGIDALTQLALDSREFAGDGSKPFAQQVSVDNFDVELSPNVEHGVPPWKQNLRAAIDSQPFRLAVVACVSVNTAVLALDHHGIDPELDEQLRLANIFLTIVFVLEILVKMVAFSRKDFFSHAGWKLDLLMAFTGFVDLMALAGIDTKTLAKALPGIDLDDIFAICRVIRPLRLVYSIPRLEQVYRVCVKTFAGLVYIASLAGLFMFIFSVLGMQLFGGKFDDFDHKPRAHYDSFTMAFTTTFQVMTFDSWQIVMYDGIRATGGASALYFVVWVIVGSMVMLNLLLVIILDVYVQTKNSTAVDSNDTADGESMDGDEFSNPLRDFPTVDAQADGTFEQEAGASEDEEVYDLNQISMNKSCGIFSTDSKFRDVCTRISESRRTDQFILFLIVANCVTMAMDHPGVDPDSDMRLILNYIDFVFTVLFTVEMCVHIVAIGFINDDGAYLRGWWNRLDFSIVIVSWLDYLASALEIKFLRTLRLLRALRALRMFNRLTGLKVLIDSLLDSIIALSTIFTVTMIVFLGYAILGVTAYKGRFHRCNDAVGVSGIDTCVGTFIEGGELQNNMWVRPHNNFDNVANGMFTLFTVSTSNDWIVTAQMAIDAPTYVGQQPIRENAPWRIAYFMVFIVLVNFFFLNLFIGVIYGKYVDRATAGMEDLSKEQIQWLEMLRQLRFAKPQKDVKMIVQQNQKLKLGGGALGAVGLGAVGGAMDDGLAMALDLVPDLNLKEKAFTLVDHKMFDHFIVGCIIANCIMMAATWYGEPTEWTEAQAALNIVFTLIFTVEMCLKMFAFGFTIYFGDSWCRFDCFVVTGSWADLLFTWLGIELFSSSLFRIIRVSRVIGRIGRIFKLLGDSKSTLGLDEVMECLYQALPQLAYIGILVGLILFIFAVLGMNLFGNLAHTGCIGPNTNFERAPRAALTLLGVATKDRITCTIHATMVQPPYCDEAAGTCGTPGLPQVFFLVFSLVIMFTTLEMFVNVVLQSFEDLSRAAGLPITLAHINQYEDSWKKFDPMATGWMPQSKLTELFDDLPPQVGMDELAEEGDFEPKYLRLIELPNGDFSRYLLGETFEEVREAATEQGVLDRIKRISDFVFDVDVKARKRGLAAGDIVSISKGSEVIIGSACKFSFVINTKIKKGKQYQLLADTREERDEWVATIAGAPGCKPQMIGRLLKLGGLSKTEWELRDFTGTHGTLGWDDAASEEEEEEEEDEESGEELALSAKNLYGRLHEISGLTKKEVKAMVRLLDSDSDVTEVDEEDDDDDDEGDGAISRQEFESGLTQLNESRILGTTTAELESRGGKAIVKLLLGEINFYEVLFAICERKTGKPLPNTNFACVEAKKMIGVRMPSIKKRVYAEIKRSAMKVTPTLHHALEESGAAAS
jgi:Ca2+-binding EF-hand superfamily protein